MVWYVFGPNSVLGDDGQGSVAELVDALNLGIEEAAVNPWGSRRYVVFISVLNAVQVRILPLPTGNAFWLTAPVKKAG